MSILNGKESNFEFYDTESIENLYYNISRCKMADTKENVIINKIDKDKLKNELMNINIGDIEKILKQYLNAYKKDFKYLKKFKSNHILKCIDFINREKDIIIIKEDADTNLYKYIKSKNEGLEIDEIKYIFSQINNIIKLLRKDNKIHTCICSQNLYIKCNDINMNDKDYIVKLSDFGCISKLEIQLKIQLNIKNKLNYLAPELFELNDKIDFNLIDKADLWSLGILLFFLRYNRLPNEEELKNRETLKDEDHLLTDILDKLLVKEPDKRISWENYFNHAFFENGNNKKETNENETKNEEDGIVNQNKKEIRNIEYNNGDKYSGEYLNNKKEGYGILI